MEKEMPIGWIDSKIGDLYSFVGGGTPSKNVQEYWNGSIPWASIKDITKVDILKETEDSITQQGLNNCSANLAKKGDVIIGTRMTIGKPVIAEIQTAINQDLKIVKGYLPNKFTFYWFKALIDAMEALSSGTTVKGIRIETLNEIPFPLPPLAEQQRIVAKLDTLFGHLDALKTRLDRIPQLLKDFRQKVLTQAVTGKLTEEWREGKELEEWKIEIASKCCEKVQSGGTPKGGGFTDEGIPFLKVYNIVNNQIDFEYRPQFVTIEVQNKALSKSIAYPGDVLMNIVGPPLNQIAILPADYPEWNLNQAITLFRTKKYLLNTFLYYFFCEGKSVREVMGETKGVVGQVNISLSQCRDFEIPIPPFEEQQEIVRRVESLFAKADQIEASYQKLKAKIEQLPQALLAKAFRGELVAQLPTDGDARDLLEQIKKLKAEGSPKGKGKKLVADDEARMVAEDGARYGKKLT